MPSSSDVATITGSHGKSGPQRHCVSFSDLLSAITRFRLVLGPLILPLVLRQFHQRLLIVSADLASNVTRPSCIRVDGCERGHRRAYGSHRARRPSIDGSRMNPAHNASPTRPLRLLLCLVRTLPDPRASLTRGSDSHRGRRQTLTTWKLKSIRSTFHNVASSARPSASQSRPAACRAECNGAAAGFISPLPLLRAPSSCRLRRTSCVEERGCRIFSLGKHHHPANSATRAIGRDACL